MKGVYLAIAFLLLQILAIRAQSWSFQEKLTASDREPSDRFSKDLDIYGDYLVISTHRKSSDAQGGNIKEHAGAVYVYHREANGHWIETQKLTASDREVQDNFGTAVAIYDKFLIVGAYKRDEPDSNGHPLYQSGAAYIFERNTQGQWVEVQKLTASDRDSLDYFGISVDIYGSYAVVGAAYKNADDGHGGQVIQAGAAYVFERKSNNRWEQVARLRAPDKSDFDLFGYSLALSGSNMMVGAYKKDMDAGGAPTKTDAGAVYAYKRLSTGQWKFLQKLTASDGSANDWFGYAIAIDASYAIIAASQDGEDASGIHSLPMAGSAYIFRLGASGTWLENAKLTASDRAEGDHFASSLDIRDDKILIGAYLANYNMSGSQMQDIGKAYIFERQSDNSWEEEQTLLAYDKAADDWFGFSVAIDGKTALIGAFAEKEDTAGMQTLKDAGSAYLFEKEDGLYSPAMKYPIKELHIGPNPAGNILYVRSKKAEDLELQIFNVSGQMLIRKVSQEQNTEIDISRLTPGIYFIKVKMPEACYTRPWIKSR